ncbi:family 16 glycosylhydrolase [Fredinandcohnia sp. QZ13]|uniref:beta-xylosidase family glycoside hydrolase n=1 Tax=Fredinandcohnia sp. QZ13 TaxID=3073144 RepID=UPI0028530B74|nr:family 16 glycosylhydrolase [Fredinandcohnia sp. QZ13]MDR4888382.1 family 16 glycosylhydrolase [Fredinandcohnia sp. QZ13]
MRNRSLSIILLFSMFVSLFTATPGITNAEESLEAPKPMITNADEALEASTGPFGPNVYVFDDSTPDSEIQRITNEVFKKQESNEFGNERYALLFKPGTYNANIRVGFYTHVAGLGQLPDDVTINGGVTVDAEWWNTPPGNATKNFWRAAENFAIKPATGTNKWAVSQAVPFRRMHVQGNLQLHDGGWASGGFLADSKIDNQITSGGQQQWFTRNSEMKSWSGGLWNTFFLGVDNPPESNWPTNSNTVINEAPIMREKPFLTINENDRYHVFVPDLHADAKGTTWASGKTAGKSIPIEEFYIAKPETSDAASINAALAQGKNLLFTPGIYHLNDTIRVTRPNTVVLGLGFATLMPHGGVAALSVSDVDGVKVAGLLFDAGSESSPTLMEVGPVGSSADHSDNPTSLHDLFFRVGGGDAVGRADVSLKINSNNVIGDHFWVWRADHGKDVAWDLNTTTNGLVVNGNDVTIYGLFVEHFHEYQTLWNGDNGRMYFYQSEIPYDVPDQSSWMSNNGTVNGYASYKVAESVTTHEAYGLGIYSFFRDAAVKLNSAIEVPYTPGVKVKHATSVFLAGMAGSEITHIVNNFGEAVTYAGHRKTITEYSGRNVNVTDITVTGEGGATSITTKGGTLQMSVAVTPANADVATVSWSVENVTGKATIDSLGLLKAQGDGTVKVIATAQDGSGVTGSKTITISGQTMILGNDWTWVRENKENWAIDPKNENVMKLTTQEGSWGGTKPSLLLRNPGTTGDFSISTKLKFDATMGFEWAGLIIYQDDGNFISLGRQANGSNPGAAKQIRFSQGKSSPNLVQTDKNYPDQVTPGDIYLKIEKTGNTYTGHFSKDGVTWTQLADTFTISLTNPKVGIFVRKLNTSIPVKTAEFTNFTLNDRIIPFWNPVASITVTGEGGATAITAKDGTLQMSAAALPADADNKTVIWSVINPDGTETDKATIDTDGLLTAVKDGQVKVVATAKDGSGVTGSMTIDISGQTVQDYGKITLTLDKTELWPANNKMVPIHATLQYDGDPKDIAGVSLTSITSNEQAKNDISGAKFGTADYEFELRATRLGNGIGRVYTIEYTITFTSGETTTATGIVTVPHDKGKGTPGKNEEGTEPGDSNDPLWKLVWSDEFDGNSLDESKWNYVQGGGGYGNNELQNYTNRPENIRIDNGNLVVEARKENYQGNQYTSAMLDTKNKGDWTYGRFEIRAKLPEGKGMWPAIWMMPTSNEYGGWPVGGEIDIMELLGHDPGKIYGTIHYGNPHVHSGGNYTLPDNQKFSDDFHTFSIEWAPGEIKWFVDGNLYATKNDWFSKSNNEVVEYPYPAPFDQDFHLRLNLAVGGDWPGNPDVTTDWSTPKQMLVDYVRVYSYNGQYPEPGPRPGKNLSSGWFWVRETGSHWYVEGNPKIMKITTQDGSFTNTQTAKPSNILLRDPFTNEAGDFTISTKVKFDATQNFEFAGLIVYQDDKNYVSLGRAFSGSKIIRFTEGRNGGATDKNYTDTISAQDIQLKIEKTDDTYRAFYSSDGVTWAYAGSIDISLTDPKVGIFTRKLGPATKTAEFNYFEMNGNQISF